MASGVGPAGDVPWCGPAGVEKIKDDNFAYQWYGHAFGLPDRHPGRLAGAIRCPSLKVTPDGVPDASVRGGLRTG